MNDTEVGNGTYRFQIPNTYGAKLTIGVSVGTTIFMIIFFSIGFHEHNARTRMLTKQAQIHKRMEEQKKRARLEANKRRVAEMAKLIEHIEDPGMDSMFKPHTVQTYSVDTVPAFINKLHFSNTNVRKRHTANESDPANDLAKAHKVIEERQSKVRCASQDSDICRKPLLNENETETESSESDEESGGVFGEKLIKTQSLVSLSRASNQKPLDQVYGENKKKQTCFEIDVDNPEYITKMSSSKDSTASEDQRKKDDDDDTDYDTDYDTNDDTEDNGDSSENVHVRGLNHHPPNRKNRKDSTHSTQDVTLDRDYRLSSRNVKHVCSKNRISRFKINKRKRNRRHHSSQESNLDVNCNYRSIETQTSDQEIQLYRGNNNAPDRRYAIVPLGMPKQPFKRAIIKHRKSGYYNTRCINDDDIYGYHFESIPKVASKGSWDTGHKMRFKPLRKKRVYFEGLPSDNEADSVRCLLTDRETQNSPQRRPQRGIIVNHPYVNHSIGHNRDTQRSPYTNVRSMGYPSLITRKRIKNIDVRDVERQAREQMLDDMKSANCSRDVHFKSPQKSRDAHFGFHENHNRGVHFESPQNKRDAHFDFCQKKRDVCFESHKNNRDAHFEYHQNLRKSLVPVPIMNSSIEENPNSVLRIQRPHRFHEYKEDDHLLNDHNEKRLVYDAHRKTNFDNNNANRSPLFCGEYKDTKMVNNHDEDAIFHRNEYRDDIYVESDSPYALPPDHELIKYKFAINNEERFHDEPHYNTRSSVLSRDVPHQAGLIGLNTVLSNRYNAPPHINDHCKRQLTKAEDFENNFKRKLHNEWNNHEEKFKLRLPSDTFHDEYDKRHVNSYFNSDNQYEEDMSSTRSPYKQYLAGNAIDDRCTAEQVLKPREKERNMTQPYDNHLGDRYKRVTQFYINGELPARKGTRDNVKAIWQQGSSNINPNPLNMKEHDDYSSDDTNENTLHSRGSLEEYHDLERKRRNTTLRNFARKRKHYNNNGQGSTPLLPKRQIQLEGKSHQMHPYRNRRLDEVVKNARKLVISEKLARKQQPCNVLNNPVAYKTRQQRKFMEWLSEGSTPLLPRKCQSDYSLNNNSSPSHSCKTGYSTSSHGSNVRAPHDTSNDTAGVWRGTEPEPFGRFTTSAPYDYFI